MQGRHIHRTVSRHIRQSVLGFVAIFIVLTIGTAYATHPGGADTISSEDIIDAEIRSWDIRDNHVRTPNLQNGAVSRDKLAKGAVAREKVNNGAINADKLANGAVSEQKLANAAVTIPKLAFEPWTLDGNAGTSPATDFLGTTDDAPLELRVNDARALRLEPNVSSPNLIGGYADNYVDANIRGATIGGGGDFGGPNRVTDHWGTIGGGAFNRAGDAAGTAADSDFATVGGGRFNTAGGLRSTVGGGDFNTAGGQFATVGGGNGNFADGPQGTVGGGQGNIASGPSSTVPGGGSNTAAGVTSLAAGRRAKANHDGAFVWADSTATDMASTSNDQFIARASGGFFLQSDSTLDNQGGFLNTSTGAHLTTGGVWTNASDESLKEGFEAVGPRAVLARVARLPVRSWSYKAEPDVRHLGPTAQDFHRAFGLGASDRHIGSVDADGVALAAIKGLNEKLRRKLGRKQAVIESHERRLDRLERMLGRERP